MSALEIKRFTSRMLGANTYVIHENGTGIIIDPCTKVEIVEEYCTSNDISVTEIVLTHCHIDHTLYLNEYLDTFSTTFAIGKHGNKYNMNADLNGARLFGMKKSFRHADRLLDDNDIISIGSQNLRVMLTPGHSPGSICLYGSNIVITGDTLFNLSIGRSDLPGGKQEDLVLSLAKLMELGDDTIIYPGHGTFSSIKFERENNPYLVT